jgi:hypothetical protein
MDVRASMFPENAEVVPRVAELPTCQKMLEAWAPLMRTTLLLVAVVSVLPIWKINWPAPLRVTIPEFWTEEAFV